MARRDGCPWHPPEAGCVWNLSVGWVHPPNQQVDLEISKRLAAASVVGAGMNLADISKGRMPRHRKHADGESFDYGCFACAIDRLRDAATSYEKAVWRLSRAEQSRQLQQADEVGHVA